MAMANKNVSTEEHHAALLTWYPIRSKIPAEHSAKVDATAIEEAHDWGKNELASDVYRTKFFQPEEWNAPKIQPAGYCR
jgi:hypothetical protein